jgi:hypothetical protein
MPTRRQKIIIDGVTYVNYRTPVRRKSKPVDMDEVRRVQACVHALDMMPIGDPNIKRLEPCDFKFLAGK